MKLRHVLIPLASIAALGAPRLCLASEPAQSAQLLAAFSAANNEFPESIAIDSSGNVYLSCVITGVIKKVTPAGVQSVYATIPDPYYIQGLAFDTTGNLYVAAGSGVWKVTTAGV